MNSHIIARDPDPQPPELKADNYPTLKAVWKRWILLIAVVFLIIFTLSIIFRVYDI